MSHREDIYEALVGDMTVRELSDKTDVNIPTVFRVLRVLEKWGDVKQCGTKMYKGQRATTWRRT